MKTGTSSSNATRIYDPLDPPQFGEWVRVGDLESDESARTTRRDVRVAAPIPVGSKWLQTRRAQVVALLLLLAAIAAGVMAIRNQRPQEKIAPQPSAGETRVAPKSAAPSVAPKPAAPQPAWQSEAPSEIRVPKVAAPAPESPADVPQKPTPGNIAGNAAKRPQRAAPRSKMPNQPQRKDSAKTPF